MMDWLRWHLENSKGLILAAALVAAMLIVFVVFPPNFRSGGANSFGPDWECTPQIQGGPTCIKKLKP
jgi:hypothetical protein